MPLINCSTSFLAGVVVFSILGYMAHLTGQGVDQVVQGGTGLAFVVYPESLAAMPGAPVFSVLFFTMLLCLGLDTQFAMVETLMAALRDIPQVPLTPLTTPPTRPHTPSRPWHHRPVPPPLAGDDAQGAALGAPLRAHARVRRDLRHRAG